MKLEPGPFLQLADDATAIPPGVYDFTSDAHDLSLELTSVADSMGGFLDNLATLANDPLDDLNGISLFSIMGALRFAGAAAEVSSIDDALASYADGDVLLTKAISFAPPQAWIDPPQPFLPPPDTPSLPTPTLPIAAFNPGSYIPSAPLPNPLGPWVQLLNLTRIGQTNFVAGDKFSVIGLGTPGQRVTASATFQGEELGSSDYGTLDSDGKFSVSGVMSPSNVGAWFESWYFDGKPIASFNFVVASGNVVL